MSCHGNRICIVAGLFSVELLAYQVPMVCVNLVPRVSHLTAPWGERGDQGLSSLASCDKMRDPGNEVGSALQIDQDSSIYILEIKLG